MQVLTGLTTLLVAQAGGELLSRFLQSSLQWTLPGPVLGMLIVLAALALPSGAGSHNLSALQQSL